MSPGAADPLRCTFDVIAALYGQSMSAGANGGREKPALPKQHGL
jgi:hypothetical protein